MSVASLGEECHPAFARHETFHPRFGWLKKAVDSAAKASDIFTRADAPVEMGVGKNMVHAIRYWGLAFKLLKEASNPDGSRAPGMQPDTLGVQIFGDDGWDQFMEDPATLWLLHWNLLRHTCYAPVWWLAFNTYPSTQFTDDHLLNWCLRLVKSVGSWPPIVDASVRKDITCVIRMYARRRGDPDMEDTLDCPFRDLGLIESIPGSTGEFRFAVGHKPTLPDDIVAYASVDFLSRYGHGASTVTTARLASEIGSPGKAFKLSENAIVEALERVATHFSELNIVAPAGLKQLAVSNDSSQLAQLLLERHYRREVPLSVREAAPNLVTA